MRKLVLIAILALSGCHHEAPLPITFAPVSSTDAVREALDADDLARLKVEFAKFLDDNDVFTVDEVDNIRALQKQIAAISPDDANLHEEVTKAQAAFDSIQEHHADVLARTWS